MNLLQLFKRKLEDSVRSIWELFVRISSWKIRLLWFHLKWRDSVESTLHCRWKVKEPLKMLFFWGKEEHTHNVICFSIWVPVCHSKESLEIDQETIFGKGYKRKSTQLDQEIQNLDCRRSEKISDESHLEVQGLKITHLRR